MLFCTVYKILYNRTKQFAIFRKRCGYEKVNPNLTLLALAISAFGIGSTEFISVGLLPLISSSMGVSISSAGLTVSIYALGVMVGAPVLTTMTSKMNRKNLLLLVMLVF